MKNNVKILALVTFSLFITGAFTSCSKYKGFKEDKETGLYYKFYVENKDAAQPQDGDLIDFIYTLRTKDSSFVKSIPLQDLIQPSRYKGDLYAAFKMLHLGDSATFILDADSFFHHFVGEKFEPKKKELYIDIKLNKITPKKEVEEKRENQKKQYEEMLEAMKIAEDSLLTDYIKKNNIKAKPTKSGLYYIPQKAGTGKKAEKGKTVSVNYVGKFLDGTVFDSSEGRGPLDLTIGAGMVIPGWEEGIALMKEGEKALMVLPSSIAYGDKGAGQIIPPYTPLVFEVELIKVSDAPPIP